MLAKPETLVFGRLTPLAGLGIKKTVQTPAAHQRQKFIIKKPLAVRTLRQVNVAKIVDFKNFGPVFAHGDIPAGADEAGEGKLGDLPGLTQCILNCGALA